MQWNNSAGPEQYIVWLGEGVSFVTLPQATKYLAPHLELFKLFHSMNVDGQASIYLNTSLPEVSASNSVNM